MKYSPSPLQFTSSFGDAHESNEDEEEDEYGEEDDDNGIHIPALVSSDDEDLNEEDIELQRAFANGEIDKEKVYELVPFIRTDVVNNVEGLDLATESLSQTSGDNRLAWIERMDLNNDLAPIAAELAEHLEAKPAQQPLPARNTGPRQNNSENEFKRELTFYRQAQASVLEGLTRIRGLGILTRRPDDYFAQMLKSDDHMQRVRQVLVNKHLEIERREKAHKLRDLKKFGKQVQNEVLLKRAKEKRETLDLVKKFRRGQKDKLDFLDTPDELRERPAAAAKSRTPAKKGGGTKNKKNKRELSAKRKSKDSKYGFGGKKKRGKYNDAASSSDVSSYKRSFSNAKKRGGGGGGGGGRGGGSKNKGRQGKSKNNRRRK